MTRLRAGKPRNVGSIPGRSRAFSHLENVHTGFTAHTAFYSVGEESSFLRCKGPIRENDRSPLVVSKLRTSGATPPFTIRRRGL